MDELEKDVSKVGAAAMHRDGMPLKGKAVMDKASVTLVLRRESICLPGTNVGQHFSIRRTSRCDHPFVVRTSRYVLFFEEWLPTCSLCEGRAEVQTWNQRVDGLVDDGEWLKALALALDHYEAAVKPLEQKRLASGVRTQGVLRGRFQADRGVADELREASDCQCSWIKFEARRERNVDDKCYNRIT